MTSGTPFFHCSFSSVPTLIRIQEQAGHSSIQVTVDTYGHLFPSQNRGKMGGSSS